MKRREQEISDKATLEQILNEALVCRIALNDIPVPYIVPVCFGYENGIIYFHSSPSGKKIELLKKNNDVCFEVETNVELVKANTSCGWSVSYQSIVGQGKAYFVNDPEEQKIGLDVIMEHYSGTREHVYDPRKVNALVMVKIEVLHLTGKKSK